MPPGGFWKKFTRWLSFLLEPKTGWVRQIPQTWEELSAENILFIAQFYPYSDAYRVLNASSRGLDLTGKVRLYDEKKKARKLLTYLFIHFFGVKKNLRLSIWIWLYVGADQLMDVLYSANGKGYLFSFLFERPEKKNIAISVFTHNKVTYSGPMNGWSNLRNDEFELADACFTQYLKDPKEELLDLLIAALYRPLKYGSREPFNRFDCDYRAVVLKTLDLKMKYAILLEYMAVRNYVIEKNSHVFKKGNSGSAKARGWGAVILSLAKNQLEAGDLRNAYLWDTFKWLKEVKDRPKPA